MLALGVGTVCLYLAYSLWWSMWSQISTEKKQSNMLSPLLLLPMKDCEHKRDQVIDCWHLKCQHCLCVLFAYACYIEMKIQYSQVVKPIRTEQLCITKANPSSNCFLCLWKPWTHYHSGYFPPVLSPCPSPLYMFSVSSQQGNRKHTKTKQNLVVYSPRSPGYAPIVLPYPPTHLVWMSSRHLKNPLRAWSHWALSPERSESI